MAAAPPTSPMAEPGKVNLDQPRYDQRTYWGRVQHFMDVTDIRTLFVSEAQLESSKKLVADYKAGKRVNATEDELWRAKKILDSTLHPDTGEPIFMPFRMSSFVPTNLIVTAGMLFPDPSMRATIFWQWANQSINVGFNYCNANKTTAMNMKEILTAYAGAVTTSCGVALGLNYLVKDVNSSTPGIRGVAKKLIPFAAVAAAGVANVFLMRGKEIKEGITVFDEDGNPVGKSKKAGFDAIAQVAVSRVLCAIPPMTLPPLLLMPLERRFAIFRQKPFLMIPLQLVIIASSVTLALPMAIAAFPQYVSAPATSFEPEFHNLVSKTTGKPIKTLTYNKGL